MDSAKCQILLIMSSDEGSPVNIEEFLKEKGFEVFRASNANEGISKVQECHPDLIICQNNLEEKNGLQVYNSLSAYLLKRCTPFLLYMPEYIKEDVLVAIEIGIDSFIISPFDEDTLLKKVTHHLIKVRNSKIIETEQFKTLFETTPVAKFIAENSQIIMANKALRKLTGLSFNGNHLPSIDGLFNFSENENHALDYTKCMNGLKNFCLLNSVPLQSKKHSRFDIHLVYTDYFGKGLFMAEVVPAKGEENTNNSEVENADANNQHSGNGNTDGISLSPREEEVLEWSVQGLPIKQIATILKISDRTVEKHRANIMAKTEATSMVEAIYTIRRKMG